MIRDLRTLELCFPFVMTWVWVGILSLDGAKKDRAR